MKKIIFSARLHNTRKRIKSLSGKLGPLVFRTYNDGHIDAYLNPKHAACTGDCREYIEGLTRLLREVADSFALIITDINIDYEDE